MATKVDATQAGGAAQAEAPQGASAADELAIMSPDAVIEIAGERIEVKEYLYFDGLRLMADHPELCNAIAELLQSSVSFEEVQLLLGAHEASVVDAIARSVGKPIEWVRGLNETDGDTVCLTWWLVNSGFFVRRAMRRALKQRLANAPSAPHAHSTNSSTPDTSDASAISQH